MEDRDEMFTVELQNKSKEIECVSIEKLVGSLVAYKGSFK